MSSSPESTVQQVLPSLELTSKEVSLLMTILEPIRYAQNTLTTDRNLNSWNRDNNGPVSSVNGVLLVLHTYRGVVAEEKSRGGTTDDYLLSRVEGSVMAAAGGVTPCWTKRQSQALHQLVWLNAGKLLIIEARLITEINQIIQKFSRHLENLPCDFSDYPGGFFSENSKQHKKSIFNPMRWDEGKVQHSDVLKFATVAGAYTYLCQGNDCPELVGNVDFMRVESVLLSGVTRLNGMSKIDLQRWGFHFDLIYCREQAEQFERLLSSSTSPVDVTTTVLRIKYCSEPPLQVVKTDEVNSPVFVPDEHMSLGTQVQWHVFGFGEKPNVSWWRQPLAAEQMNLSEKVTLPTFQNVLTQIQRDLANGSTRLFLGGVRFRPGLFLISML